MAIFFICTLPCLFSLLCLLSVISRWSRRNQAQRAMGYMLVMVFLTSLYFFIFQIPAFRRAHRIDWMLTTLFAFLPASYYLFIRKLTGTGRRSSLVRAYSVPAILSFISLVLNMAMGDKGAGDYMEHVKLAGPVTLSALPLLWKVKYIYANFIFRTIVIYRGVVSIGITYRRIALFHDGLKDYYADAETKLFRSGAILRAAGIAFLFGMMLMTFGPYYLYSADIYYVAISVPILVISLLYLTAYCLHQPISAETLAILSEETKNMGMAMKDGFSLMDRLENAISDEFFTAPDVTVMGLSETIGTNRAYLSDLIHVTYGMSFADFVNDLRIRKAIEKMHTIPVETPLSKVAVQCGYSTYTEFAHIFEKFIHLTPSEWMKRYRKSI